MNKETIKEIIKELFEDGTIEIVPQHKNSLETVELWVKIDGEVVQIQEG